MAAFKQLYHTAFPKSEQKPFFIIKKNAQRGIVEMLEIDEDGEFCGLAVTIHYKDLVLLDYFAITPEKKGKGIGSKTLSLIKEKYKSNRLLLEIEAIGEEHPNNQQRIKRQAFYMNNGMINTGKYVNLFGTEMLILSNGKLFTFDEYKNIYKNSSALYFFIGLPKEILLS